MSKVWFITGVSTGLGRALAEAVLQAGDRVVGTLRKEEERSAFAALSPGRSFGVLLDVTDAAAIEPTVARIEREVGPIDVLVNNAGYGLEGAVEEISMAQARHQFDVNFFGALEVTKAVLPAMRQRCSGHIINITSIGGLLSFPGVGIYNATKFALEGLTDALAQEVAHLGIHATAIEPGPFRTDWAGRSMVHATPIDDYLPSAGAFRESLAQRDGRQAGDPARAATAIIGVVNTENPPRRLVLGLAGFKLVGENLGARQAELARWADVSLSADYPAGE